MAQIPFNARHGLSVGAVPVSIIDSSGNVNASTLSVSGSSSLTTLAVSGVVNLTSDININTNKFNVVGASGNTSIAGTLGVTGLSTLGSVTVSGTSTLTTVNISGNVAINTNKFNVASASGDTLIAGTLGVTGQTTLGNLTVSGTTNLAAISLSGNISISKATPILSLIASDVTATVHIQNTTGSADINSWRLGSFDSSGTFRIRAVNDALVAGSSTIDILRTTNNISAVKFGGATSALWINATNNRVIINRSSDDGVNNLQVTGTSDFIGNIFVSGGAINISRTTADALLSISANTGQTKRVVFQTGGVARFSIGLGNEAESGSNAGSHFRLSRMTDGGSIIDSAISVYRDTGTVELLNKVAVGSNTSGTYKVEIRSDTSSTADGISITNNGTGTATAIFQLISNASSLVASAGNNTTSLLGSSTSGLVVGTSNTSQVAVVTNGVSRLTVSGTTGAIVLTVAGSASGSSGLTVNQAVAGNAITSLVNSTTTGTQALTVGVGSQYTQILQEGSGTSYLGKVLFSGVGGGLIETLDATASLVLKTNGVSTVFVDSSNNVGIGAASDGSKLNVTQSINGISKIAISNTNSGTAAEARVQVNTDTSSIYLYSQGSNVVGASTGLKSSNALFIGTTVNSAVTLQVNSTNKVIIGSATVSFLDGVINASTTASSLTLAASGTDGGYIIAHGSTHATHPGRVLVHGGGVLGLSINPNGALATVKVENGVYFNEYAAASNTIDWNQSNKVSRSISGNTTFTFTAPPGPTNLVLKLSTTGAHTLTWPATVKWPAGAAPTLNTGSKVNLFLFYYDGTNYYGSALIGY